ncbi:MAG: DUF5680 domain-containing protein [Anaerolineaceae bacterium]
MTNEIIYSNPFILFLIKAKQNTYAGEGQLSQPSRPTSKDLAFQEGSFKYIDTYLGDIDFMGEEAVWYEGKPIWGMNYVGRMLVEKIPGGFIEFLKKALINVPQEMPYRGPEEMIDGDFSYTCCVEGAINWYKGVETILYKGQKIYQMNFHGGSIRSV